MKTGQLCHYLNFCSLDIGCMVVNVPQLMHGLGCQTTLLSGHQHFYNKRYKGVYTYKLS